MNKKSGTFTNTDVQVARGIAGSLQAILEFTIGDGEGLHKETTSHHDDWRHSYPTWSGRSKVEDTSMQYLIGSPSSVWTEEELMSWGFDAFQLRNNMEIKG